MLIKSKLILALTSTLIISSLVTGGIIYYYNEKILTEHALFDIENNINYSSQLLTLYFDVAESNLTNLSNDPVMMDALLVGDIINLNKATEKLSTVSNLVDAIENISLQKISGKSCISIAANDKASAILGADFSERDYCQGIIKSEAPYVSSAYISVISNNPAVAVAIPIKNSKSELLGLIVGNIDISYLRGYLWDLQKNSKIELLDRYGTLFVSTEEKINDLNNLTSEESEEIGKINADLSNDNVQGNFKDHDNFVGYKKSGSFTVIFEESRANSANFLSTVNSVLFFSMPLIIALTIMIINLMIAPITRRISRLSKITQEIASGKLNIKIESKDLTAKDETALLARSFNDMSGKLAESYKDLEKKVKDRTKELEKSENSLSKTLAQSEKMNKLMIGRELEMIKLKQRITDLESGKKL